MRYLLDTNAIIGLVMNADDGMVARAAACEAGEMVTSAIAYAEVVYGSTRGRFPAFDQLAAFIEEVPVLDFGMKAAMAYASMPLRRGRFDRLIAAHALSEGLIVVTHNIIDFADVTGLEVENWMSGPIPQ